MSAGRMPSRGRLRRVAIGVRQPRRQENRRRDRCRSAPRDRSPALPDTRARAASPPCRTPRPPHRRASGRSAGSGRAARMKYRLVWPPDTTSTADGQRQLAVRERQRLDVPGEVMHRNDRDAARPGERLCRTPRRRAATRPARAPASPPRRRCRRCVERRLLRAPPRTTPQMSRTCWRDASSGTTPPHSRWIAACEATTFERMRHGRAVVAGLGDDGRGRFVAGRLDGEEVHRGAGVDGRRCSSAFFSDSVYGAVKMPRSVMMPVM